MELVRVNSERSALITLARTCLAVLTNCPQGTWHDSVLPVLTKDNEKTRTLAFPYEISSLEVVFVK